MSAVAAAAQSADLRYFSIHNGDLAYADNRQSLNNGSLADGVLNDFYEMLSTSYAASVPTLFGLVRLRERAARLCSLHPVSPFSHSPPSLPLRATMKCNSATSRPAPQTARCAAGSPT